MNYIYLSLEVLIVWCKYIILNEAILQQLIVLLDWFSMFLVIITLLTEETISEKRVEFFVQYLQNFFFIYTIRSPLPKTSPSKTCLPSTFSFFFLACDILTCTKTSSRKNSFFVLVFQGLIINFWKLLMDYSSKTSKTLFKTSSFKDPPSKITSFKPKIFNTEPQSI